MKNPSTGDARHGLVSAGQHGFTLIEALTALSLFAIVLAGLTRLQVTAIETHAQARQLTAATLLAQAGLEALQQELPAAASGSDPGNPLTEAGEPGGFYYRHWARHPASPIPGLNRIEVTVRWTGRDGERAVALSTVMAP
jgi:prepilin-type N-terminal cleavage/methylation domain-containing protein